MEARPKGVAGSRSQSDSRVWHVLQEGAVLELLGSKRAGLSPRKAEARRAASGPNQLRASAPVRPLALLARQLKSLIVWILAGAEVVSGVLGERADCIATLAIDAVKGLIGFVQELHAEHTFAALRRRTAPQARVRRAGRSSVGMTLAFGLRTSGIEALVPDKRTCA